VRLRILLAAAALASLGGGYNSPPLPRTGPPPPPPSGVGITQRLGERVPLDIPFRDESGRRVALGDCTGGKPTILVLAYYRCPMLCTEVLNGLLDVLRAMPADVGSNFNVVVMSFDPRERPPLAAVKKAS
jgi:protein SCO1/2